MSSEQNTFGPLTLLDHIAAEATIVADSKYYRNTNAWADGYADWVRVLRWHYGLEFYAI
jgi:hypothetical protein